MKSIYDKRASSGLDTEQRYFPDKTQFVISVRVDQMLTSDAFKKIKNDVKQMVESFLGHMSGNALSFP